VTLTPLSSTPAQTSRPDAREGRSHAASLHRIARIVLLATIFAAPWAIGAVEPWAWGALTGLAMLVLILWGAGWVQRGVFKLTWSSLYLPFLALIALALFQFFEHRTSDYPATREAVLKLLTDAVFFFLAGQLLFNESRNGKTIKQWGSMVLILAFGLSTLAVAQILTTGHGWIYWVIRTDYGPFGPYVSANDYCGLLEMLVPVAAGYILSGSSRRVPRIALWLMVGGCLGSVAMSGSRAGAVVMVLEVLIFTAIALRYRSRAHWHIGLLMVLGLLVCSVGIFAWVANGSREADRALSVFQTDKSIQVKMGDRLWVAKDTLRMALHHPISGVGVGAFETAFPPYMSHVSDLHWTHAHDDIAEGLSETGLPGAALLLWGLILFLSLGYFHIRDRVRADWGWIPVGALVGATGLLFHSLVDFNLRVPANALWFVVCLAVATQPGTWPDRPPRRRRESIPETDESIVN
jgi:hypothetical protein